jgi:hypothetical protein
MEIHVEVELKINEKGQPTPTPEHSNRTFSIFYWQCTF